MPVRLTPRPARLAITTMRPLPFFFMPGVTARLAKNAPSTLTAWIARQSSSLTSSTGRLLWPRTPPATCTSTSTPPQACSTSRTKASTCRDCVRSTLRVSKMPPRPGLARAFRAKSWSSSTSQAHTLAPRSTKPSTIPPPMPRAAPVTMTAWLSKWMSISRSLRRLRLPKLGELGPRQLEGAPHLAAVAATLMRRQLCHRGEDALLHVVAPIDGQGGQYLGQGGIVGVGPFALVGLALGVEGEDTRLDGCCEARPAGGRRRLVDRAVANDHAVVVGRGLHRDLALLHVEQHRLGVALRG